MILFKRASPKSFAPFAESRRQSTKLCPCHRLPRLLAFCIGDEKLKIFSIYSQLVTILLPLFLSLASHLLYHSHCSCRTSLLFKLLCILLNSCERTSFRFPPLNRGVFVVCPSLNLNLLLTGTAASSWQRY